MVEKYDQDYKDIIAKLNEAFMQDKDKADDIDAFKELATEKKKLIADMPYEELRKVKAKIHRDVEDISYLTENEKFMLNGIRKNDLLNYKQAVWHLTGKDEMIAVVSFYPHLTYTQGAREIIYKVFEGMQTDSSSVPATDETTLRKMNEKLRARSIEYWIGALLPAEKRAAASDELKKQTKSYGKTYLYRELGEDLTQRMMFFCEKNKISIKALLLYAWADLRGKYNSEENPVVAVAGTGGKMNILPIKVPRSRNNIMVLQDIDRRLAEAVKYLDCTVEDVEVATGITFSKSFSFVHYFMELPELRKLGKGNGEIKTIHGFHAEDTDIDLCISYQMFDRNIMINYTSKGAVMEIILDNLHDVLIGELSMLVVPGSARFDKSTFIKAGDTNEEKRYKILLAQIGLYLKNSGIFQMITVDEIMKLAEYCRLRTYLSGDSVITEKTRISNVCILGDGTLEESRMDADGMVKTVRIIKQDSVFGIESLFLNGESGTTYTVISPQAKIVEIDSKILTEALRRVPEGWIALLQKENDQKSRLQRLWTMV